MFASVGQGVRRRPALPAELAARARPVSSAASRLLPLPAALVPLFPDGALRRGSTTLVAGSSGAGTTTLALALLSAVSATGGWCAAVGVADPGVVAAVELGLDLRRVVFVPRPAGAWADAAGELLGAVEAVVVRPPGIRVQAARRLTARARERRTALVVLAEDASRWPSERDVTLTVGDVAWEGAGEGHGRLLGRRVAVIATARRPAEPPTVHRLWLPSSDGTVTAGRSSTTVLATTSAAATPART
jgi:hypothetical protein